MQTGLVVAARRARRVALMVGGPHMGHGDGMGGQRGNQAAAGAGMSEAIRRVRFAAAAGATAQKVQINRKMQLGAKKSVWLIVFSATKNDTTRFIFGSMYTLKLVEAHKEANTFGQIHIGLPDEDSLACISMRVHTAFLFQPCLLLCLLVVYISGQTNTYGSRKRMETISYPCSPVLFFPTHEESSYSLWSPQLTLHENATIPADPSPDAREDCEFFNTIAIDSSDSHDQHAFDVDVFTHCDEWFPCQESANLAAIQDELMEENSLSDLLLTGADAVEAGDSSLALAVLSQLNGLLASTCENAATSSFGRLAYHFAQGLQSRMSGACSPCYPPDPMQSGIMSAHQMIQELSPYVKFAHFTANQAILDATIGDMDIHVIDFNLGEGIQWPSLMSDLARHGGKSLHLTAIITDAGHSDDTHQAAARRLSEFAESLNLPFQYNSLCVRHEEDLDNFSRYCEGPVVVSCDTTNLCYRSGSKLQMLLLGCVRKLQPKSVVVIEEELVRIGKEACLSQASFVEFFFEALHHFTMVFESLSSCFSSSNNRACLRLVEKDMVGPKVQDFVGQYGSVTPEAAAPKALDGFKSCELSACNIAQARMLVGLFNRSFGITHEKGRLQLCWKTRPLISVSVWTPV